MIFVRPDDAIPSGGNVYDRRVIDGLRETGWEVTEIAIAGSWPRPSAAESAALGRELAAATDGSLVVLDGLVACGVPDVVVPHAHRLRLVVLVHLPLGDEGGPDLDARERTVLHAARAVVTTSPAAAERVRRHHGLAQVHVVIPGTDAAEPAPGTDGVSRLVCVASVTPRKGQDLLVEALTAVADRRWTLDCVGPLERDPSYVGRVRELIAAHGLGARVRLLGSRTAIDAVYAEADLVVLPSRAETYGMVVTEALARGIPVLASATPDALGDAGLSFPPGDLAALTAALRAWFDDPALRENLHRSAHRRRGALTPWTHTVRRMTRILATV